MMLAPQQWLRRRVAFLSLAVAGCQLPLPAAAPMSRMLEPQLQYSEPAGSTAAEADSRGVRLLDTQARGHIRRRLLWQQADGELVEDPVWHWSSDPDRYLDTALRVELAGNSVLRHVDSADAPTLALTLLAWHLDAGVAASLVGAVELRFTETDRSVRTEVVRASEPVSSTLPGDLAAVSGRLLRRLAAESLMRVAPLPEG